VLLCPEKVGCVLDVYPEEGISWRGDEGRRVSRKCVLEGGAVCPGRAWRDKCVLETCCRDM
jgi:hypothetical protein